MLSVAPPTQGSAQFDPVISAQIGTLLMGTRVLTTDPEEAEPKKFFDRSWSMGNINDDSTVLLRYSRLEAAPTK